MPNRDGMGPQGNGPITGRASGPCEKGRGDCCSRFSFHKKCPFFKRFFSKNCCLTLEEREKALENELKIIREEKESLNKE